MAGGHVLDLVGERHTDDELQDIWESDEAFEHESAATSMLVMGLGYLEPEALDGKLGEVTEEDLAALDPYLGFDDDLDPEDYWRPSGDLLRALRRLAAAFRDRRPGTVIVREAAEDVLGPIEESDAGHYIKNPEDEDRHEAGDWQMYCAIHLDRLANLVEELARRGEKRLRLEARPD